jgi:hypothetical protein
MSLKLLVVFATLPRAALGTGIPTIDGGAGAMAPGGRRPDDEKESCDA